MALGAVWRVWRCPRTRPPPLDTCPCENSDNVPKVPGGETLAQHIYSYEPEKSLTIGKRNEGHVSNYYLGSPITDEEVAAVQRQAETEKVDVLNTR